MESGTVDLEAKAVGPAARHALADRPVADTVEGAAEVPEQTGAAESPALDGAPEAVVVDPGADSAEEGGRAEGAYKRPRRRPRRPRSKAAPAATEPHLRKAYNGFRRMGLDADTAESAALLGRACRTLDRVAEADELCSESERLAGHALKPSIAWRTLRARLLSRRGESVEARRVAEAAVSLAERTDALVDHADACLALATVLGGAGDVAGARAAAERAVGLYERKGAAALAERARGVLGKRELPATTPVAPAVPTVELDNACARVLRRGAAARRALPWAR